MFGLRKAYGTSGRNDGSVRRKSSHRTSNPESMRCEKLSSGTIKITIPLPTPSLNETIKQHWARRVQTKQRWAWLIRAARLNGKIEPPRYWKAHLTITRYGARLLDVDNLIGGQKSVLLDNLVKDGFIHDDAPEHLTVDYRQAIGSPRRTEIEITEVK